MLSQNVYGRPDIVDDVYCRPVTAFERLLGMTEAFLSLTPLSVVTATAISILALQLLQRFRVIICVQYKIIRYTSIGLLTIGDVYSFEKKWGCQNETQLTVSISKRLEP